MPFQLQRQVPPVAPLAARGGLRQGVADRPEQRSLHVTGNDHADGSPEDVARRLQGKRAGHRPVAKHGEDHSLTESVERPGGEVVSHRRARGFVRALAAGFDFGSLFDHDWWYGPHAGVRGGSKVGRGGAAVNGRRRTDGADGAGLEAASGRTRRPSDGTPRPGGSTWLSWASWASRGIDAALPAAVYYRPRTTGA